MLKPFSAERMGCFKIGTNIGNVKNDDAALIDPVV